MKRALIILLTLCSGMAGATTTQNTTGSLMFAKWQGKQPLYDNNFVVDATSNTLTIDGVRIIGGGGVPTDVVTSSSLDATLANDNLQTVTNRGNTTTQSIEAASFTGDGSPLTGIVNSCIASDAAIDPAKFAGGTWDLQNPLWIDGRPGGTVEWTESDPIVAPTSIPSIIAPQEFVWSEEGIVSDPAAVSALDIYWGSGDIATSQTAKFLKYRFGYEGLVFSSAATYGTSIDIPGSITTGGGLDIGDDVVIAGSLEAGEATLSSAFVGAGPFDPVLSSMQISGPVFHFDDLHGPRFYPGAIAIGASESGHYGRGQIHEPNKAWFQSPYSGDPANPLIATYADAAIYSTTGTLNLDAKTGFGPDSVVKVNALGLHTTGELDTSGSLYEIRKRVLVPSRLTSSNAGITVTPADSAGTAVIAPVYGSSANTITQGNDSRLSDARTPVGTALTSTDIWVGNGSNQAAAVAVTGDVTISNAGVTAIGLGQSGYDSASNQWYGHDDAGSGKWFSSSELSSVQSIAMDNGSDFDGNLTFDGTAGNSVNAFEFSRNVTVTSDSPNDSYSPQFTGYLVAPNSGLQASTAYGMVVYDPPNDNKFGLYLNSDDDLWYANGSKIVTGSVDTNSASDVTDHGNATTTLTDLKSVSISAATNTDKIVVDAAGIFAANATTKDIKVVLGSTTLFDTSALVFNNGSWSLTATIYRVDSTHARCDVRFTSSLSALPTTVTYTAATENIGSGVNLKIQAQSGVGGANNDTVLKTFSVENHPVT